MKMKTYDAEQYDPPAPIVVAKVSKPYSAIYEERKAKIDTGADMSVIPNEWVEEWSLLPAGTVEVFGYDKKGKKVGEEKPTYFVNVSFNGFSFDFVEVVSADRKDVLIGRDVINKLKILLDGKNLNFEITDPK